MNARAFRRPGVVVGGILALPVVLLVGLPPVVTFLEWLGRVTATILGVIVPGADDGAAGTSRSR